MNIKLDGVAKNYHLNAGDTTKDFDNLFHQMCLHWIQPMLLESKVILQLGYGEGLLASALISADAKMDIVEGSTVLAEHANKKLPKNVSIHNNLFEEFHPSSRYDCIVATNVLEHVDDPVSLLKSIYHWLESDGIVIVSVPNAHSIHRQLAVEMGLQSSIYDLSERDHLVGHQRVYDMATLINQVQSEGFSIRERRGFVLKVVSNAQQNSFSEELISAFHTISPLLAPELLANIGLVLTK